MALRTLVAGYLVTGLLLAAVGAAPAREEQVAALGDLGSKQCNWPSLEGDSLLDRRIGDVQLSGASLTRDLLGLLYQRGVPLSFIEADADSRITLDLREAILRQVLDGVLAQAPTYQYGFLRGHLILYPRASPYTMQLEGFSLPPTPRLTAAYLLVTELQKRYGAFSQLGSPGIAGDPRHFAYQDPVSIAGTTTVLDAIMQLLGNRPSVVVAVALRRWGARVLDIGFVDLVHELTLKPEFATLHAGETMHLHLTAMLAGGATQDLTSSACGTTYELTNNSVASVDQNGMLKTLALGTDQIVVRSQAHMVNRLFKVVAADKPASTGRP